MTLSDGFNAVWQMLQVALQRPGARNRCLSDAACSSAVLVGELLRAARGLLAAGTSQRGDELDELQGALLGDGDTFPHWEQVLRDGRGHVFLSALLSIAAASLELPPSPSSRSEQQEERRGKRCDFGGASVAMLQMMERGDGELAHALSKAPPVAACGGLHRWLLEARPTLRLAASSVGAGAGHHRESVLSERRTAESTPRPESSAGRLTHTLCEDVLRLLVQMGGQVLHIHGASLFEQGLANGRRSLRFELLHFMSTDDECIRLTVYGKTPRERNYYAHALTLPANHLMQLNCSIGGAHATSRIVSYFGYDAVAYCEIEVPDTAERIADSVMSVELNVASLPSWTIEPIKLCPILPLRRFR
eukprot:CAMPEP_0204177418 /NCGR_PEP_ID=MMETSP0361-20130328/48455_1 /ASSEMBLY_ACC=CAM_ASM_000343 /TAXON_ID=268821 /ORGANISM="Scrippsiella Hangoei, Strain SHTV-5" /LENGTH=361 /DNA_ID=CAMNT_0051136397 /DNA_START=36 /DNA_END=1118 /DNA_ORIENTATION=-